MEFWGIEIQPGKPFLVVPEEGYMYHVSQVSLGEVTKVMKGNDNVVPVYIKNGVDKDRFILGSLSQKFPQVNLDIFFGGMFEISHNCQTTVFLMGYKSPGSSRSSEDDEEIESDSELEEFMEQEIAGLKSNELIKTEEAESDEEDGSDSDEFGLGEDEDESDEEEEKEEPLKVEPSSKKRPNSEAMKNTVASKKAKVAIQNKSSGKGKRF